MTNGGSALLLTGPKDRRAEFAITREMDEAVKLLMGLSGVNRSDACRLLMARGITQDPALAASAVQKARESRERDATEQAKSSE